MTEHYDASAIIKCKFCWEAVPPRLTDEKRLMLDELRHRHFGHVNATLTAAQVILMEEQWEFEYTAFRSVCSRHTPRCGELARARRAYWRTWQWPFRQHNGVANSVVSRPPTPRLQRRHTIAAFLTFRAALSTEETDPGLQYEEPLPPLKLPPYAHIPCYHTAIRKPIAGNDCPICWEPLRTDQKLLWCKQSCGVNFHRQCSVYTVNALADADMDSTGCPVCRTKWLCWRRCACDEHVSWCLEGVWRTWEQLWVELLGDIDDVRFAVESVVCDVLNFGCERPFVAILVGWLVGIWLGVALSLAGFYSSAA